LDRATFDSLAILFVICLPGSIFSSCLFLMSDGLIHDWLEQSPIFRLVSRWDLPGRNTGGALVLGVFFFALLNAFPVLLLADPAAAAPAGPIWAYFIALAVWFTYVGSAALRAKHRRELGVEGLDEVASGSLAQLRRQALINQLDFEDALESGSWWGQGQADAERGRPVEGGSTGRLARTTTDDPGEPCAVYPVEWQGSTILPTNFDVGVAADSYQGALVFELAKVVDPLFPVADSPDPELVVRSRIVIVDPGNRFMRWMLPLAAGAAVFEVEAQIRDNAALFAQVRAHGKRRWRPGGGISQEMLVDAAKLAGQQAAGQLLAALAKRRGGLPDDRVT
jgi:hypothetical protein